MASEKPAKLKVYSMATEKPVKLNVGGRRIETAKSTLSIAGGRFFEKLLDWESKNDSNEIFIDKNPDAFAVALDFIRTGIYAVPKNVPKALVVEIFNFLQIALPEKKKKRKSPKKPKQPEEVHHSYRVEKWRSIGGRELPATMNANAKNGWKCFSVVAGVDKDKDEFSLLTFRKKERK